MKDVWGTRASIYKSTAHVMFCGQGLSAVKGRGVAGGEAEQSDRDQDDSDPADHPKSRDFILRISASQTFLAKSCFYFRIFILPWASTFVKHINMNDWRKKIRVQETSQIFNDEIKLT